MADLVVCIEDEWHAAPMAVRMWGVPDRYPKKGIVYTVTAALEIEGDLFYQLAEMQHVYGWYAPWFRPVNESKLDIFRKADLPIPVKKKELEKV